MSGMSGVLPRKRGGPGWAIGQGLKAQLKKVDGQMKDIAAGMVTAVRAAHGSDGDAGEDSAP